MEILRENIGTMDIGDDRNPKFKTQHNIKDIKREMKNIQTEPPSKWRGKQRQRSNCDARPSF